MISITFNFESPEKAVEALVLLRSFTEDRVDNKVTQFDAVSIPVSSVSAPVEREAEPTTTLSYDGMKASLLQLKEVVGLEKTARFLKEEGGVGNLKDLDPQKYSVLHEKIQTIIAQSKGA
jgi:hypothetical protein